MDLRDMGTFVYILLSLLDLENRDLYNYCICAKHYWLLSTVRLVTPTLSEEIPHPTVYHHLSQLSVDMQLNGLIKCREDSCAKMQLIQVIFRYLRWVPTQSAAF